MATKSYQLICNEKAFTLLELMVALVMALLLIGGTIFAAQYSSRTYRAQERTSDAQQNIRSAMDMMVRDIRMAGYDPLSSDAGRNSDLNILTADPTQLRFTLDRNNSGFVEASAQEDVTYTLNGSEIRRITDLNDAAKDDQPFVDGVSALTFTYLDSDAQVTATTAEIAMIDVTITLMDRDKTGGSFTRSLTTRINCRNLRM
jgi:type IV pilus assembly protein PilW